MITVLLAHYKGKKFIDEQIDSILSQTLKPSRVIILDDASNDGSYEYLRSKYDGKFAIEVLRNEKNMGVVKTFERLLSLVRSDFFALSDQDDVWVKEKLERELDTLKRTDSALVYSDLKVVDESLNVIHPSKWKFSNTPPVRGSKPLPVILRNPITGCTILAKTEILSKALPFPKIPMHDRWLGAVSAAFYKIDYVSEPLVLYRQHGSNEVGGFSFGFKGFLKRVKKSGGGIKHYLKQRLLNRFLVLKGLEDRQYNDLKVKFLLDFYQMPPLKKLFYLKDYLSLLRSLENFSLKTAAVDIVLTTLGRV